tara:strand:+ start:168 stop:608 length:441 start_codon:yes stop_codon:yes gene_type:complete
MYDDVIKIIYKELPIDQVSYLTRPEFSPTGPEKEFYNFLKKSMSKHGFKDPVHIEYGGEDYGDILKVLTGNNRMVIAKELGIDKIPAIIVNCKADTFNIEGKVLNTDEDIREHFHLPDNVAIRRDQKGIIDKIMPINFNLVREFYV